MTEREALKLALDALEELRRDLHHLSKGGFLNLREVDLELDQKITAIKEALAQPEEEPCGGCDGSGWIPRDPDIGTDQECFVCEGTGKNIDTTPPQRKPLTDEQIINAADCFDWGKDCAVRFARAIEAAHGIKGEA